MSRRSLALFTAALLLAAAPRAARAQAGPAPGDTLADSATEKERTQLYREGVAAAEAGRWAEALERFQRVVALRTAPRALLALAAAEEHVGRLVGAKRTYGEARDDARAQKDEATATKAEAALAALEPRIPSVAIMLPADVTDAEALIDGARIEISTQGVFVDPGVYRLVVTASGRPPFETRVALAAGQRRDVAVIFPTPGAPTALALPGDAGPQPSRAARTGPPLASWILGGAGVAALGVGLGIRLAARSTYDEAKAAGQIDRGNDARDNIIAGTIVMGAGAALLGAGGVWWAVAPSPSQTTIALGGRF
jgi:tetratricopeptide (TPR) repeat protein